MLETRTFDAEPSPQPLNPNPTPHLKPKTRSRGCRGALPEASGNGHGQRCCCGGSGWLLAHRRASDPPVRQGDLPVWFLVGNGGMDYGDDYWGLYRDYDQDPFPHSLQSTRGLLGNAGQAS